MAEYHSNLGKSMTVSKTTRSATYNIYSSVDLITLGDGTMCETWNMNVMHIHLNAYFEHNMLCSAHMHCTALCYVHIWCIHAPYCVALRSCSWLFFFRYEKNERRAMEI